MKTLRLVTMKVGTQFIIRVNVLVFYQEKEPRGATKVVLGQGKFWPQRYSICY